MNNYYPGDNTNGYQFSFGNNNINNPRSLLLNSGMNIARINNSGIDLSNPNGYQSYQPVDLSKNGYGYQSQNIDMAKGRFSNSINPNFFGNDNSNGRANYAVHSDKQADFDQRQRAFNENIIARSNEMKAKEENARNIDRLNRINAEMTKKKYVNQMDLVKQAQFGLSGAKNSNSVYDQLQDEGNNNRNGNIMRIQDQGMNDRSIGGDNRITSNQQLKRQQTPEYNRPSRQIQSQGALQQQQQQTQPFSFGPRQPGGIGQLNPSSGSGPYSGQFGGGNNYAPPAPYSFGMPQQYPAQVPPMFYPSVPTFPIPYPSISRKETKTSKPLKEISKVIEKQNEVMSSLMQKLNEPEDRTRGSNTNQMEDVARYMQMFNQINELKMQQQQMQQQQQYAQPNPNNGNNQVVQLMFQQQMMQALMYNQMMQNQKAQQEQNARPQKMTALEMIKKMEREEALENTIKQLILAKGGNLEELQAKLDLLMGVKKPVQDKPPTPQDDDSDDTDSNDDDDDGPEIDEAALLAAKKKEMAAKARARVKAVAWMNVFAFIMIHNQKLREDERRQEVLQSIKIMQQICMKTGLLWAIGACEKSFAAMRAKPKDNYDIINDVDKLKTNMLEDRVNQICNLTTLLLDGIFESLPTLPADIAKYSAIFYQEKSYLPQGCVSQFEVDRLEFSTTFGYVLNMTQERKVMLTGLHFFIEILIIVILAKPWDYQMNETRLKDDDLTKQKLRTIASLIYHILFEHFKKTVNPVQNNILGIPENKKPQHKQEPHLYELGVKNNADKGTRYNIVTGLIDFNSLLVVWTTKGDWKNEILQKILKIISFITEKATKISDEANELERLDYIKAAQEDQLLLPVSVRKTKFDTTFQK